MQLTITHPDLARQAFGSFLLDEPVPVASEPVLKTITVTSSVFTAATSSSFGVSSSASLSSSPVLSTPSVVARIPSAEIDLQGDQNTRVESVSSKDITNWTLV